MQKSFCKLFLIYVLFGFILMIFAPAFLTDNSSHHLLHMGYGDKMRAPMGAPPAESSPDVYQDLVTLCEQEKYDHPFVYLITSYLFSGLFWIFAILFARAVNENLYPYLVGKFSIDLK
jgi:hypothetical protein